MNRSLEDINAEFGDAVAVHYYGATEADEKEYAQALDAGEADEDLRRAADAAEGKTEIATIEQVSKA